jgi:cation-transporting ATPase E
MPGIVGEGRRVINNIQRAATLFLVKNIFSLGLSIISFFTNWPYPMVPFHLSVISALTIGVPSFFLAMEPNYERVSGKFLPTVLGKALPGGLTNLLMVLLAQLILRLMNVPAPLISTTCAAILGGVGMTVLYRTCKPFGLFRRILWGAMLGALVFCFTVLSGFFDLTHGSWETTLVMLGLLALSPVVFALLCKGLDWIGKKIQKQ